MKITPKKIKTAEIFFLNAAYKNTKKLELNNKRPTILKLPITNPQYIGTYSKTNNYKM